MSELKGDYQCYGCGYTEHDPAKDVCPRCQCRLHEMKTVEQVQSDEIATLRAENERLKDRIDDYVNSFKIVLDDRCPKDEVHCGCVPILRSVVNNYRNSMVLIATFPDLPVGIINIAEECLKENSTNDISSSKAVGEYWVDKLNETEYALTAENERLRERCEELESRLDIYHGNMYDVVVAKNAELTATVERMRGLLRRVECSGDHHTCSVCHEYILFDGDGNTSGHADDCELKQELG